MFQDIKAMQEHNLTWQELMDLPERVFMAMERIAGLEHKKMMRDQAAANYGT